MKFQWNGWSWRFRNRFIHSSKHFNHCATNTPDVSSATIAIALDDLRSHPEHRASDRLESIRLCRIMKCLSKHHFPNILVEWYIIYVNSKDRIVWIQVIICETPWRKASTFDAPKSANLIIPSASTSTLPPLMSLCTIFFPCRYSSPRRSWRVYTLTNGSLKRPNLSSMLQKKAQPRNRGFYQNKISGSRLHSKVLRASSRQSYLDGAVALQYF